MDGSRVMDLGLDTAFLQIGQQAVAVLGAHDVKMVNVLDAWAADGGLDAIRDSPPCFVVSGGVANSSRGDVIQLREKTIGDDSLDGVEPTIDAEELDFIAGHQSVVAVKAEFAGQFVRAGRDHAAVRPYVDVLERVQ